MLWMKLIILTGCLRFPEIDLLSSLLFSKSFAGLYNSRFGWSGPLSQKPDAIWYCGYKSCRWWRSLWRALSSIWGGMYLCGPYRICIKEFKNFIWFIFNCFHFFFSADACYRDIFQAWPSFWCSTCCQRCFDWPIWAGIFCMIRNLHLSICILRLFDGTLDIKLSNVLSESKFSPRAYIY